MNSAGQYRIRFADDVSRAMAQNRPVLALESTVIAHGLPYPLNIETARECEEAARSRGVTPATIGIVDGALAIGLSEDEIRIFAGSKSPGGMRVDKVGLNNMAAVIFKRAWGATTVAATLRIAHRAGLKVFSTGGIGGVHRGAGESFDISADLTALSRTPLVCVSAGAKAILDLPKTRELLETLGVPVVGYQTEEFPAFYSRSSKLRADITVETPDEAAEVAVNHWRAGNDSAVLVCVPVPEEFEIPFEEVERAVAEAVDRAERAGVIGKAVTPFLLAEMERLTGGNTLATNRALLANNASIAARIAACLNDDRPAV
ncbi:MAG TPA: pseudouridine-5'-phosphate glycosidase [Blastocatellia bacterium]|nr:pseudouridine-5'-phosphate glycosidase [Blastocatellia bacterium]